MSNEYYISAGLVPIDNSSGADSNSFYISAGLVPNDYPLTTAPPTTVAPTTSAPTTLAPTTLAPTTLAPTTLAPTTLAPTTLAPTTAAPCEWDDDFDGSNGDPPDSDKWIVESANDGDVRIVSNKMRCTIDSGETTAKFRSTWFFTGDFEITIHADLLNDNTDNWYRGHFGVSTPDNSKYLKIGRGYVTDLGGRVIGLWYDEGSGESSDSDSESAGELSYDLKIIRSGSNCTAWYDYNNTGWVQLGGNINLGTGLLYVRIGVEGGSLSLPINIDYNDFVVVSGCDTYDTTAPPTTAEPTTLAPTTVAPTTLAPTTVPPTTAAPTTAAPTTAPPTTVAPTTLAPTTLAPTTLAPDTDYWKTCFGEYATDGIPGDWTEWWNAGACTPRVRDNGDIAGKCLQTNVISLRYALTWDDVGSISDGDILYRFRIDLFDAYRLYFRVGGSSGSEDCYFVYARHSDNTLGVHKYVSGVSSSVDSVSKTLAVDTWYWGRVRFQGNSIKTRVWSGDVGDEPGTWDIDTTDSSLSSGYVGVGAYGADVDTDFFSVADHNGEADNVLCTTAAPTTVAPTTLAPTTLAPTTLAPTTVAPTTLAPTTEHVATTAAPTTPSYTTIPPTTELVESTPPPTTLAPTTVAPTTVAPTTTAPTTVAPTSVPPTTSAPTTVAPTTAVPTTVAPTTVSPTTSAPTTSAPTTLAPTTSVPTTVAPTTLAPTTTAPTTLAATTGAPTTLAPTTESPTTVAPTTAVPTTFPVTTVAPTTVAPTTVLPTTLAPTTVVGSTAPPTTSAPTTVLPTTIAPTTLLITTVAPTTDIPEEICSKVCEGTIVDEIICYTQIVSEILCQSTITEEILCHGNLC